MKILVLGASGMLGNAVFKYFSSDGDYSVFGAVRNISAVPKLINLNRSGLIHIPDFHDDELLKMFLKIKPDVVINCIGIVKQAEGALDHIKSISINSLLPHRLASISAEFGARFIHFSTDCVFSGLKGQYAESDHPDAEDLYGRSKLLGETVLNNSITLRTSIIGHELDGKKSLINWFLSQEGSIRGYRNAFFSGLPTVEMARVIRDFILPNASLHGLFHVSVDPISKFDLLKLVSAEYKKKIEIISDELFCIDRSLNSSKFRLATGFQVKPWPQLIAEMHSFG